jgi:NAD(P)H-dependent FMN reductase
MLDIAIIVGSSRPGGKADAVADWVLRVASSRSDARFEVIDIREFDLDAPPVLGAAQYHQGRADEWAAKIARFDGFIFVTPEYAHGTSAALRNAIELLHAEWMHKAAGFVGYGSANGKRAVEQLRLVMGAVQVADVRAQVMLSLYADFENFTSFKPSVVHEKNLGTMLDQLVAWSAALQPVRAPRPTEVVEELALAMGA